MKSISETRDQYNKTSRNFLTPEQISVQFGKGFVVELSAGKDMDNKRCWGVTVLESGVDYMSSTGEGQLFKSYATARRYYNELVAKYI